MFSEEGCPAVVTAGNPPDSLLAVELRNPLEQPLAPDEHGCQRREKKCIPDDDDDDGNGAQCRLLSTSTAYSDRGRV
jgi:hypothetical protein